MEKRNKSIIAIILFCAFGVLSIAQPTVSHAALITIDQGSDLFTDIGDFAAIAGVLDPSAPGQVYEVLGGPGSGLQSNGTESETRSTAMGLLWTALNDAGITSATSLVFAFGLNESGSLGSNYVDIDILTMEFELPTSGTKFFDLDSDDDNTIRVYNLQQGQNLSEAQIQVNLGFDFMTEYSATSTEPFTISSQISSTDDGFEIYFLSSAFTASPPAPVPEPATMLLLGSGLLGLAGFRRRLRKR